jgi:hypothetical protein
MKAIVLSSGLLLVAGVVGGVVVEADAATSQNVNTSGTTCNNFNAGQANDIDYLTLGVRNAATSARPVICSVERHPVTGPSQSFFIDGSNAAGQSTTCSMSSFSFFGTFQSAVSFTESTATYDHLATLTTVNFFDYVSLLCILPANFGGVLFGVTALDS